MIDPIWAIMPVLAGPEMTEAALSDLLAQSVPTRVLVINQGVDDAFRDHLEALAEQDQRIFLWHHQPPLPSLSASWNLALDLVWHANGTEALVVNNDVRLIPRTIEGLLGAMNATQSLFVSAVGVTPDDYAARPEDPMYWYDYAKMQVVSKGGPDFSCFLISRACHQKYRFDEGFIPAFCEDLDYHRRLMLAGDGAKIFSINLPYLHLASQTLKTLPPEEAQRIRQSIDANSRAYYAKKWGGPVNAETFWRPFDGESEHAVPGYFRDPTTPALQRDQQQREQQLQGMGRQLLTAQEHQDGQVSGGSQPERPADPLDDLQL